MFRIFAVIANIKSNQETKSFSKIIGLIILLTWYVNVIGCLWAMVAIDNEEWIPNKDFIWAGNAQLYEFYYMPWTT
jgi:hypothetical protein